jgi:hypothetical protein
MFERFRRLFGLGGEIPASAGPEHTPAPRTHALDAQYRPALPEQMRQMHVQLLRSFEHVVESEQRDDRGAMFIYLRQFELQLREYLSTQEAEFHAYMSERLHHDVPRLHAMRTLRARLRQLAHEVHDIVRPPPQPGQRHPAPHPPSGPALPGLGRILRDCLELQELELLPHYRPATEVEGAAHR